MKQIITISFLLLLNNNVLAQHNHNESLPVKKHVLKTNVLGLFTFFYEHPIRDKLSFQVGLQYNPENLPLKDKMVASIASELRFYFFAKNGFPSGIFISPYAKYQHLTDYKENPLLPNERISAKVQTLALGGNIGYQILIKNKLVVELFIGGGYNIYKNMSTNSSNFFAEDDYNFDVRLGIGFGYAF